MKKKKSLLHRLKRWWMHYDLLVFLILWALVFFGLIVLLVYGITRLDSDGWVNLLSNLFEDLPSAIILAVAYSILMKIAGEIFPKRARLKVQPENNAMNTKKLFSDGFFKKKVPKTIKLLSLTGEDFLWDYKRAIVNALDNGVEVRLMIASPSEENEGFLVRRMALGLGTDYIERIQEYSFKRIAEILQRTKNPQNFKVRFFLDEYQHDLQIAKYERPSPKTYCWVNLTPMRYKAFGFSVEVRDRWYNQHKLTKIKRTRFRIANFALYFVKIFIKSLDLIANFALSKTKFAHSKFVPTCKLCIFV